MRWPAGYRPVSIETCDGSVSGTGAYACRKRRPRAATALKAVVVMPTASGPIASARVVSSVTSRMDGRGGVPAAFEPGFGPVPHALIATAPAIARTWMRTAVAQYLRLLETAIALRHLGGGPVAGVRKAKPPEGRIPGAAGHPRAAYGAMEQVARVVRSSV